jgi:hypothetical protein
MLLNTKNKKISNVIESEKQISMLIVKKRNINDIGSKNKYISMLVYFL